MTGLSQKKVFIIILSNRVITLFWNFNTRLPHVRGVELMNTCAVGISDQESFARQVTIILDKAQPLKYTWFKDR